MVSYLPINISKYEEALMCHAKITSMMTTTTSAGSIFITRRLLICRIFRPNPTSKIPPTLVSSRMIPGVKNDPANIAINVSDA
jgi:hypothetical protein